MADQIIERLCFKCGADTAHRLHCCEWCGEPVTTKIEGATFFCELPAALGAVTGMRVQDGRLVCDTESGIPFIINATPRP